MNSLLPFLLFGCGRHTELASQIAGHLGSELQPTTVKKFSDADFFRHQQDTVRDRNIFVILQPSNDEQKYRELFELFSFIEALRQGSPKSWITVVMPYLPFQRQDRPSKYREPVLTTMIPQLLQTCGANQMVVVRLHNPASKTTQPLLPMENIDTTKEIVAAIRSNFPSLEGFKIVAPDMGAAAYSRQIASQLGGLEVVVVDKRRGTTNGEVDVMNVIGEVQGFDLIMVDDIADTCGTAGKGKKALMEKGAQSVHFITTHAVLSGGKAIETLNNAGFSSVMFTNSCHLTQMEKDSINNFREIDISKLLSNVINNLHNGESLHLLQTNE